LEVLKSGILGVLARSTNGHLIVEYDIVISWAIIMVRRPCIDLWYTSQSFISFNPTTIKEMQNIITNSVD